MLLIAAVLEDQALLRMLAQVKSLGMEALVEVHREEELERVLRTDAEMVGINNRNLSSFEVDLHTTERLLGVLERLEPRSPRLVVAESGVRTVEDARFLRRCGVDGVLVGESLMRAPDPTALVAAMRTAA